MTTFAIRYVSYLFYGSASHAFHTPDILIINLSFRQLLTLSAGAMLGNMDHLLLLLRLLLRQLVLQQLLLV